MKGSPITARLLHAAGIGVFIFYFGIHLLHSDQGLIGRAIEEHKQELLREKLKQVRQQRQQLEHKVSLLEGPEIDGDLLGELARRQLPVAGRREVIFIDR